MHPILSYHSLPLLADSLNEPPTALAERIEVLTKCTPL